jgi:hypothetical protein
VPTKILSANKFTKVLYDGPRRSDIKLRVEASGYVNIYGVTSNMFELFKSDRKWDLFEYRNKTALTVRKTLNIDESDEWYLIIENRNDHQVAIHYEVFDV